MSDNLKKDDEINFEGFEDIFGEDVYESITMIDDDGNEVDYFIIDAIDVDKVRYLLIVESSKFDEDEPECMLVKETADDGSELIYDIVEDDAEYNKVMVLLQDNENNDYEMKF